MQHFFFIGKSERIVLTILILTALGALLLYILSLGQEAKASDNPQEKSLQTQVSTPRVKPADTLYKDQHYVGPPQHLHQAGKSNKFKQKQILDLNRVDSLTLVRVPGIGPAFARRILALRERLGGYYTTMQLQEVYGMDEDKYLALRSWFSIKTAPKSYRLSELRADEIPKHLYLSWEQQNTLRRLINRKGKLSHWAQLMKEHCFSKDDSIRLSPYFIEDKTDKLHTPDSLQKE